VVTPLRDPNGADTGATGAEPRRLEEVDRRVIQLFAEVGEAVAGATLALLTGDREAAKAIVARDQEIDRRELELEHLAWEMLERGAGSAAETRYIVSMLRILPEIERTGDLAEHVASRASRGLGIEMSAKARGIVERMGELACSLWGMAADAYGDRSVDAFDHLDHLDDQMDELSVILTAELVSGQMSLPVAIEVAMIGRFYERIGDHSVNLARQVREWIRSTEGRGGSPR
jgi:phosphate transport system protein